jgi:cytochrome c
MASCFASFCKTAKAVPTIEVAKGFEIWLNLVTCAKSMTSFTEFEQPTLYILIFKPFNREYVKNLCTYAMSINKRRHLFIPSLLAMIATIASFSTSAQMQQYSGGLVVDVSTELSVTGTFEERHLAKLFKQTATSFNKNFVLPRDVTLQAKSCGRASAFFDAAASRIVFCTEMVTLAHRITTATWSSALAKDGVDRAFHSLVKHILHHEIAHVLLHGQPAFGKNEDNADFLAVYTMPNNDALVTNVLLGVLAMHRSEDFSLSASDYGAKHSISLVRRANIVCWYYGKMSTSPVVNYVSFTELPPDRRNGCKREYATQASAANVLLDKFRIAQNDSLISSTGRVSNDLSVDLAVDLSVDLSAPLNPIRGSAFDLTSVPNIMERAGCINCHAGNMRLVGPSYQDIAERSRLAQVSAATLARCIQHGCRNNWGSIPMPAQAVSAVEAIAIAEWIIAYRPPARRAKKLGDWRYPGP